MFVGVIAEIIDEPFEIAFRIESVFFTGSLALDDVKDNAVDASAGAAEATSGANLGAAEATSGANLGAAAINVGAAAANAGAAAVNAGSASTAPPLFCFFFVL